MRGHWLVVCALVGACGNDKPSGKLADAPGVVDQALPDDDAPAIDAAVDAAVDAIPPDAFITGGLLLVTESPPGPQNGNIATWGGIVANVIGMDGGTAASATGIDKALVNDPADVIYRAATSELFVGNRHGNNSADGTAGSIDRFVYDPVQRTFATATPITGNGLAGVHQVAFSPTTGELFAANVGNGISRFTFDNAGNAVANGQIIAGQLARGVAVSPDGNRLYVSGASNTIRQFDLANNATELTAFAIAGAQNLHFFAQREGQLYVAALDSSKVHRLAISAANELTLLESIDSPSPIGVAFSESGREMFVSGHRAGFVVTRFDHVAATDTWTQSGDLAPNVSLGGIAMLPIR